VNLKKLVIKALCDHIPTKTVVSDTVNLTANPLHPFHGSFGRSQDKKTRFVAVAFVMDVNLDLS
jgi:hypothetical protein